MANQVGGPSSAFASEDDQVTILTPDATPDRWPKMSKNAVAQRIMKLLGQKLKLGD